MVDLVVFLVLLERTQPEIGADVDDGQPGLDERLGELMREAVGQGQKRGVAVPGDVMVTGFDGVPGESEHAGRLTTIVQPLAEIGSTAITRLVERVRNRSLPRCTILLDAPLVVRESTAAKAKGKR